MSKKSKQFLFGTKDDFSESNCFIVIAENEKQAINKAAKAQAKCDDLFVEFVYDKSINMSFAETFCYQQNAVVKLFSEEDGERLVSDEVVINELTKRVEHYFKDSLHLAKEYLDYFFSEKSGIILSDEIIETIWIREWNDYIIIDVATLVKY